MSSKIATKPLPIKVLTIPIFGEQSLSGEVNVCLALEEILVLWSPELYNSVHCFLS